MKDLKFRVWDNKIKYYIMDCFGRDSYYLAVSYGGLHRFHDGCSEDTTVSFEHINSNDKENRYVIEQYTGLKDKNGKEIYLGDIVSEHNGDIVGEIIQKPNGVYCIAWAGIYGGSSVLYDEISMCEVIGNIHENNKGDNKR